MVSPACSQTFFSSTATMRASDGYKMKYPLFGLSELGNITAIMPTNHALEVALQERRVVHAQFYTPTVKAMEERVPLLSRPHLLTYLLGEGYIRNATKFKAVWDEVRTQRTLHELIEVVDPAVPLDARMELVITEDDTSFLASFGHRRLARAVVKDGLLVKVSGKRGGRRGHCYL